jgi:uncharacterized protein DUF2330
MSRRLLTTAALCLGLLALGSGAAFACGGLVAPGHAEVLRKAVTLSAWHDGLEHYVTGFEYAGTATRFGYIIPLPGNPTKIEKAGDWTLERLEREINPVRFAPEALAADATGRAQVLQQVTIEALDITVVRGAGDEVAAWARANGFALTPDAPEVLGRYASEGAVFALARFNATEAARRDLSEGQGQVIHFTIPTSGPWIPLRILALGKSSVEVVDADLFLLTDRAPALLHSVWTMPGMTLRAYRQADPSLLQDLRSDRGMSWLPASGMWFSALSLHTQAATITQDLSIGGSGPGPTRPLPGFAWGWWAAAGVGAMGILALMVRKRPARSLQAA